MIETVFAMVFLAIGLLATAQMIPVAGQHLVTSRQTTEAEEAAQTVLEDLRALPYDAPALTAGLHSQTVEGMTVEYVVLDNVPVAGTKRINLTVRWADATGQRSLNFTTLVNR